MIAKVWFRQLLTGEAYPLDKEKAPPECVGCRRTDSTTRPLFRASSLMRQEFVTCRPCFQTGRSK